MHLLRVQGFYFSTPQNSAQGFAVAFPAICRVLPLLCNGASCYTAPPATRRSVSQRCNTSSIYSRYHRHAGRYAGQHSRPIIIRYIRVQHIADHASPAGSAPTVCGSLASATPGAPAEGVSVSICTGSARRLVIWHPTPGGAVQQRGAAGGAEPLTATAVSLFGLSPDS